MEISQIFIPLLESKDRHATRQITICRSQNRKQNTEHLQGTAKLPY